MKLITGFVMGILIFSVIIAASVNYIGGITSAYNVSNPVNSSFNATFNKIENMTNLTNQVNGLVNGSSVQQGSGGVIGLAVTLSNGVYNGAKLVLNSFGVVNQMLNDVAFQLQIPKYLLDVLLTVIMLGMVAWFFFAIFKVPS